jgi:hypothetical protein
MNKNVTFSKKITINSVNNYINEIPQIPEVDNIEPDLNIPSLSINMPKLYSFEELKNDEEIKKEIIINELKIINAKLEDCNTYLREIYISVYILLSKDNIGLIHLHGIYSTLDKGTDAFNKIINYDNKISKLILYKSFVNNLGCDYDLTLFDDNNEDKIYEKIF